MTAAPHPLPPEATLLSPSKITTPHSSFLPPPAPSLSIPTAELTDPDGKLLIDYFATSPDLRFSLKQWLPKEYAAGTCPGVECKAGIRLSDHTGVLAEILSRFAH
jgi:hypothetical protein